MSTVPPHSIVSGVEYGVDEVNGQPPGGDQDFDGAVTLALTYDPPGSQVRHEQVIHGVGMVSDGGIFVNEKDDRGRDLRRWRIRRRDGSEGYVAQQGLY
jgi:hypothetical protein